MGISIDNSRTQVGHVMPKNPYKEESAITFNSNANYYRYLWQSTFEKKFNEYVMKHNNRFEKNVYVTFDNSDSEGYPIYGIRELHGIYWRYRNGSRGLRLKL